MNSQQATARQQRRYRLEWVLFAVVAWLVFGLAAYALFQARRDVQAGESDRLRTQARVVSENLLQQFSGVNKALTGVRDDFFKGEGVRDMQAMTRRRLQALTEALPGVRTMFVLDAQGRVVAANREDLLGRDVSGREYFTTPRDHADRDALYISRPFKSVQGVWVVNLSRVLVNANGGFAGVVVAGLDPDHFNVVIGSVLYAPDMRTTLVHGDGIVFLNMPPNPGPLGANVNKPGSFYLRHLALGRPDSLLTGRVLATGEDRMVATRTIERSGLRVEPPMLVHSSREIDAIYAPWRRQAYALSGLLFVVAAGSASALLMLQLRRRDYEALSNRANAEREAAQSALADSGRLVRAVTDNLPIMVSYIDVQERLRFLNATSHDWLGVDPQGALGRPFRDVIGEQEYALRQPYLARALGGERVEFEVQSDALGVQRHLRVIYVPDLRDDGSVAGIYGMSTDVSALKHVEQQLSRLARFDALTGLANRRQFNEKLAEALDGARRSGDSLALMFLDVDHFKSINDTLGHAAGDAVLKEFARRLQDTVRSTDCVARLAGDEFVIILEGLRGDAEPQFVARKIIAQVSHVFDVDGRPLNVSTSMGIAFHRHGVISASELLARADAALYEAKAAGRNTYRVTESEGA